MPAVRIGVFAPVALGAAVAVSVVFASSASGAVHPRWLPVKSLSSIGASGVRVAMDGRGDATVVWAQDEGTGSGVVEAAYRPAGGSFRSSRIVSGPGLWAGPDLGVDSAGDAALVWATGNPPDVTVQVAARAAKAHSFGAPATLDGPHHLVFSPTIAVDAAGDAVAAWITTDDIADGTCCQRFVLRVAFRRAGGSFSVPSSIDVLEAGSPPELELAMGSAGDAALVVATDRHPKTAVIAFYRHAGGVFGRPRVLAVATDEPTPNAGVDFVDAPEVAVDAGGDVLAAWTTLGPVTEVRASYRPAGRKWQAPELVANGSAVYRVAFDSRARPVAAWIDGEGTVRLLTRSSAGTWRSGALSPPGERPSLVRPGVAVGPRGDLVVAWANLVPAVPAVSAIVRERGGVFRSVHAVSDAPGFPLNPVQLAVDARGNAVAAWQTARSLQPIDTGPNGQWIEAAAYEAR